MVLSPGAKALDFTLQLRDFMLNERLHHVTQHREAVFAGTVEFAESVSVTPGAFLF